MNIASIIIPTHNRCASLKRMLLNLEQQFHLQQNFEVIVVADGCRDDTVETVKNYRPSFQLSLVQLPGVGAARARNEGAAIAKGQYLIFVDDDMELCSGFIQEHLAAHATEDSVVIGYSPLKLEPKASIQRMTLREWWEEKFHEMKTPYHQFRYDDLTSGNFSISNSLFRTIHGFDMTLLCREDYELGFRLIKAGARFSFTYRAKAIHRDEVTDLGRSLLRKRSEGIADMQVKEKHPDFINREAIYYVSQRSISKSILLKAVQYAPGFMDGLANFGTRAMNYFEKFRMQPSWLKLNYRLHQYWYLRGLMVKAGSSKNLYRLIAVNEFVPDKNKIVSIDLKNGLEKAEEKLDRSSPQEVTILFGENLIGVIHQEAGTEPLQGRHLKKILKDRFSKELSEVLIAENFKKPLSS